MAFQCFFFFFASLTQSSVATSVAEAEIAGMSEAAKQAMRLHFLLRDIFCVVRSYFRPDLPLVLPVNLHCDNRGGVKYAGIKNGTPARLKHIDIREHSIRDMVRQKQVKCIYVASLSNKSNGLTEVCTGQEFHAVIQHIGLETLA